MALLILEQGPYANDRLVDNLIRDIRKILVPAKIAGTPTNMLLQFSPNALITN
ncbi:MAG: hypothetical protein ACI9XK_004139 [Granulosicoccus sp.]|jgi:hypothetical protein